MIEQLKLLLRLKELKEEKAFRAVNRKRREVTDALSATDAARQEVQASAATLPIREDAIYRGILGRIVDFDTIDDTKTRMQQLENSHTRLIDAVERAKHVQARLENELAEITALHLKALKDRDRYTVLTDEVRSELRIKVANREESEIEDTFSARFARST